MECFGILRYAQDDSKDLQWQEQSNAEDNSKGKSKIKNKDKRQERKQTRAKTKATAGFFAPLRMTAKKHSPKKLTAKNSQRQIRIPAAPIYGARGDCLFDQGDCS